MTSNSTFNDAINFADEIEDLHKHLEHDHRALNGVKKEAAADNFPNADEVLKKIEANIKNKKADIEAAKVGLQDALSRLDPDDHIVWWKRCQRFSPKHLAEYAPVVEEAVEETAEETAGKTAEEGLKNGVEEGEEKKAARDVAEDTEGQIAE